MHVDHNPDPAWTSMKINWKEAAGSGLIMTASCSWGGAASIGKGLFQAGVSTFQLMQLRSVVSTAVLFVLLIFFGRKHLRIQYSDVPAFLLLSIPGLALVNASYYHAIRLMPVAIAVFIQFTAPVVIFLYGWGTGKEEATSAKFGALLLCLAGTYFMVQIQRNSMQAIPWFGLTCAIISMLSYAFYVIVSHGLGKKHSPWTIVAYGYGFASLFWLAVQNPLNTVNHISSNHLWQRSLLFALCSTLIPFILFLTGLRRVTPTGAAVASTSETVAASLFAFLFLGETLTPWQILGGGLIVTAVVLLVYQDRNVPAAHEPADLTL